MKSLVYTVGHSNRTFDEFLALLNTNGVATLVDVRMYPGSFKFPHFHKDYMIKELTANGIFYRHIDNLGGRRKPRSDSKNAAWRNESFRGYADYMETEDFQEGFSTLLSHIHNNVTAFMCSEALWWQCHRALIADLLKSYDYRVIHILSAGKLQEHPYTKAASIVNGKLSYEGKLN
jgi:uncharacterized protein (DUF488 family)